MCNSGVGSYEYQPLVGIQDLDELDVCLASASPAPVIFAQDEGLMMSTELLLYVGARRAFLRLCVQNAICGLSPGSKLVCLYLCRLRYASMKASEGEIFDLEWRSATGL